MKPTNTTHKNIRYALVWIKEEKGRKKLSIFVRWDEYKSMTREQWSTTSRSSISYIKYITNWTCSVELLLDAILRSPNMSSPPQSKTLVIVIVDPLTTILICGHYRYGKEYKINKSEEIKESHTCRYIRVTCILCERIYNHANLMYIINVCSVLHRLCGISFGPRFNMFLLVREWSVYVSSL
jgi:hypothetical protein